MRKFFALQDYNSEIEHLRREVHKYRMELSNRDLNFNRMFTDKQPIVIDPRAGKIGVNQIQAVNPHHRVPSTPPKTSREKSFSLASGQVYDRDVSTLKPHTEEFRVWLLREGRHTMN